MDSAVEGTARHGLAIPRGQGVLPGSRGGRFDRLFPDLPVRDPGGAALDELAGALKRAAGRLNNRDVPSGYTYLGQFIDHDITFDPVSQFERDNDPNALVNFRTPRFDLDSLYGTGPVDQPFLYEWSTPADRGVKLLVGRNSDGGDLAQQDLPRNEQGRALVGDARNDENLILSQLHLLFVRFHNAVVDHVRGSPEQLEGRELFAEAQRLVRWHYQWIVAHDYLPKIVGATLARAVLPVAVDEAGITVAETQRRLYRWKDEPAIPVEFSGAAFRFAHSMVRDQYAINETNGKVAILGGDGPNLGGFRRLPAALEIDWQNFFQTTPDAKPNHSSKIDEHLAEPLFRLPLAFALGGVPTSPGPPSPDGAPKTTELARLNLHRGRALGLPSGADVAQAMGQPALSEAQLFPPPGPDPDLEPGISVSAEAKQALLRATPLWYYLLREAKCGAGDGNWLGPVGGRIVAEVLVGLLEGDPESYLRQAPAWRPQLPGTGGEFTMADLVNFTNGVPPAAPPAPA